MNHEASAEGASNSFNERAPSWEAVTVEPSNPKLTPLALEKVTALRLFEVVPAERLIAEINPAVDGTV
jgi:hypothetical protein